MGFFQDLRELWKKYGWHIMLGCLCIIFVILFIINQINRQNRSSSVSFSDIYEYIIHSLFQPQVSRNYGRRRQQMSKGESHCKDFVQFYFQKPFVKARPDFLRNPVTKENLELDLYNEELGLAIEYNGIQHYKYNSFMHKNSSDRFQNQQYRDLIKQDLCQKAGIKLIIVPYTIPHEKISDFLYQEFKRLGFEPRVV